jgi:16S rRNA (guanine966-N2)-methyltransferase
MRIIAGLAKGRRLKCPRGQRTRPTSDRVRESIFSILGDRIAGSRILDLYAGTGAMGLEAMSRGAQSAVFIERDPLAVGSLKENILACGFQGRTVVTRSPVVPYLRSADFGTGFDVVFADPPYGGREATLTLMALAKRAKSLQGCLIVLEHAREDAVTSPLPDLQVVENRRYGSTALTFFHVIGDREA